MYTVVVLIWCLVTMVFTLKLFRKMKKLRFCEVVFYGHSPMSNKSQKYDEKTGGGSLAGILVCCFDEVSIPILCFFSALGLLELSS